MRRLSNVIERSKSIKNNSSRIWIHIRLFYISERDVGVMRQGDFADFELTTYDIRHLKQLY